MAEIYIEFHHIRPDREPEVRALLGKYGFPDLDEVESLYGDQHQNYQAGRHDSEGIAGALIQLGCTFDLTYRSETDGAINFDPELGRYDEEHGEGGDSVMSMGILYEILKLDDVEQIRALINTKTGAAWAHKFEQYAKERAEQSQSED